MYLTLGNLKSLEITNSEVKIKEHIFENKQRKLHFVHDFFQSHEKLTISVPTVVHLHAARMYAHSQSLSPLTDSRIINIVLPTARHQQGGASTH